MTPDDLSVILSEVANSAQALHPGATRIRRTLETLLDETRRVEAAAERIIVALKGLHPPDAS